MDKLLMKAVKGKQEKAALPWNGLPAMTAGRTEIFKISRGRT